MFQQIHGLSRKTSSSKIVLVGTGFDRHLCNPPRNDGGLLGLDHAYSNISFSSQQVAHGVAGDNLHLYLR
jgi:hypothetical protein